MTDITEEFNKQKTNLMAEAAFEKLLLESTGQRFSVKLESEKDTISICCSVNWDFYITLSGDIENPTVEINCPQGPIEHLLKRAAAIVISSIEQKSKVDAIKEVFGGIF